MGLSDIFKNSLKFKNVTNDDNKQIHKAEKKMSKGKTVRFSQPMSDRDVDFDDDEDAQLKKMSVSSTAIDDIEYDPTKEIARVKFTSGDKYYSFPNMPQEEISRWLRAPSKGKYYHAAIKDYSVPGFRED